MEKKYQSKNKFMNFIRKLFDMIIGDNKTKLLIKNFECDEESDYRKNLKRYFDIEGDNE